MVYEVWNGDKLVDSFTAENSQTAWSFAQSLAQETGEVLRVRTEKPVTLFTAFPDGRVLRHGRGRQAGRWVAGSHLKVVE